MIRAIVLDSNPLGVHPTPSTVSSTERFFMGNIFIKMWKRKYSLNYGMIGWLGGE
jgi:hypothetical protein